MYIYIGINALCNVLFSVHVYIYYIIIVIIIMLVKIILSGNNN